MQRGTPVARTKKIDFQDLRVDLEGDLDTDGFLQGKDSVRAVLQEIRRTLHIRTDADEPMKRRSANSSVS